MDIKQIKEQAEKEFKEEQVRIAVDLYKIKLKKRKWWHVVMPYRIVIIRRN